MDGAAGAGIIHRRLSAIDSLSLGNRLWGRIVDAGVNFLLRIRWAYPDLTGCVLGLESR
jgi:hypothetical protein